LLASVAIAAQSTQPGSPAAHPAIGNAATIRESDLREYLSYLSADELTGREVFTEGYGVASQYIADTIRGFGVKPLGDHGTYFQMVRYNDVRTVSDRSTLTVTVNGQSRTFANGDGVSFETPAGGKQTLTFDSPEFLSHALYLSGRDDYSGRTVRGKAVVWVSGVPSDLPAGAARLVSASSRARHLLQEAFAGASILYVPGVSPSVRSATFRTTENFSGPHPPEVTVGDEAVEFMLSGTPGRFAALKAAAASAAPLPSLSFAGVKLTLTVDATYQVLRTQLTRNVVGLVEGSDPALSSSYVMYGAHLDHVGTSADSSPRGRVNNPIDTDRIWNGADDDGSGSAGLLGIAKTFATGPKPKRSIVFVWHAGEEAGLLGSLYNADFPVVPLQKVVAQLNIDMIGRDRDNDPKYANTVFVIGADRISTDLHNAIVRTDAALPKPVTLDYEYNDPADPQSFYYRSDHFSYAAKDVPIAFFFTGTHPDYHANSDSVEKIEFGKMARIAQLVYQTGFAIANAANAPAKDHLGPRAGKGFSGLIKQ
jgi:hypothetical protein